MVSLGCSGRVGNKRLITDLLGRMRFVRLPYKVLYVVLYCLPYGRKGSATEVVDAVLQIINWSIRKDVVVVAVSSSRWGSPPNEKFSRYLYHVAAPALRRRTHVSTFTLAVYWHDPDGTPIAVCQVPGLHHVEVQRPIFMEPF